MTRIVDDCPTQPEPFTAQERRDLKDERDGKVWRAMYAAIVEERKARGQPDQPIVIVAEIARRQRVAREEAE